MGDHRRENRKRSNMVYMARQPIFTAERRTYGYELLYRESETNAFLGSVDGNRATRGVISGALLDFGLMELTQGLPAFVNFTQSMLLDRAPLLLNPKAFVIEILEDVVFDEPVLERMAELKRSGFTLALDDYAGQSLPRRAVQMLDIVKLDLRLTPPEKRAAVVTPLCQRGKRILAEKVETKADFDQALKLGCQLYQGYFFTRPFVLRKRARNIATVSYVRLAKALARKELDPGDMEQIISADAHFTYQLLKRVRTLRYYRGKVISTVRQGVLLLGEAELRRWGMLVLFQGLVDNGADELVRTALVRALFCEDLARCCGHPEQCNDAFSTGLLSVIEWGDGEGIAELPISPQVTLALAGLDNALRRYLDLAVSYGGAEWERTEVLAAALRAELSGAWRLELSQAYQQAVRAADRLLAD